MTKEGNPREEGIVAERPSGPCFAAAAGTVLSEPSAGLFL